jgi:heptosyltransferase III
LRFTSAHASLRSDGRSCFAALAKLLHERHAAVFLVLWSPGSAADARHPGDDETAETLERLMQDVPAFRQPTRNLADLIAALSACDAVVCSDGGAMHIAAALGKPLVCFFGDSSAARWRPWHATHELLQPPSRHVRDVTVEEAAAAFARLPGPTGLASR